MDSHSGVELDRKDTVKNIDRNSSVELDRSRDNTVKYLDSHSGVELNRENSVKIWTATQELSWIGKTLSKMRAVTRELS
jgi:hypothetical protein